MQVVHLCVSGGWVVSLYNQQFSQPPTLFVYAYRRPSAVKRAERSVLVAAPLLAPPRSSGLPSGSGSPARPGACPVTRVLGSMASCVVGVAWAEGREARGQMS